MSSPFPSLQVFCGHHHHRWKSFAYPDPPCFVFLMSKINDTSSKAQYAFFQVCEQAWNTCMSWVETNKFVFKSGVHSFRYYITLSAMKVHCWNSNCWTRQRCWPPWFCDRHCPLLQSLPLCGLKIPDLVTKKSIHSLSGSTPSGWLLNICFPPWWIASEWTG